ncbi:hypothetical protein PUNSTDRAFT_60356, partial [Punctularia strigosozonata HHB-11173 SS5]|uniref:uncharacterized protein n=1 Tax=Punctularia strigosozonata (strain HHB-11173) TaxID=741275 RepID=UPI00044173C3
SFPHGGYLLAIVAKATYHANEGRNQPDILHISASYLRGVSIGPCEIHTRPLSEGSSFRYVEAELHQRGHVRIKCTFIFGSLGSGATANGPPDQVRSRLNITPSSPLARHVPLSHHPSRAISSPTMPQARFRTRVDWAIDPAPLKRNKARSRTLITGSERHGLLPPEAGGGLEWAAWFDFTDEDLVLEQSLIVFFSDVFGRTPDLYSAAVGKGIGDEVYYSYTTLALHIDFISPFPKDDPTTSKRSVGLYSVGKFMRNGLHDGCVEIWSSPGLIGAGTESDGWREKAVCLATASQVTLAHPLGNKLKRHIEKGREEAKL